jgi:hypothetical protein
MRRSSGILPPLILCLGVLAGCATTHPVAYQGLASSSQLSQNPQSGGHVPFLYSADNADSPRYNSVMLEPVACYDGPDQQFGDTSQADKKLLVEYAQTQFTEALKSHYAVVAAPGPNTLRVRVTLTGIETNTPGLAPLMKIFPLGLLINTVDTVQDRQGPLSGSVSFAVEIYDSASNRLLRAYVSKEYPAAENIGASFGALDASKAGIRKGAQSLVKQLRPTTREFATAVSAAD